MIGLLKSLSRKPTARSIERLGARCTPSVISLLRSFSAIGLSPWTKWVLTRRGTGPTEFIADSPPMGSRAPQSRHRRGSAHKAQPLYHRARSGNRSRHAKSTKNESESLRRNAGRRGLSRQRSESHHGLLCRTPRSVGAGGARGLRHLRPSRLLFQQGFQ